MIPRTASLLVVASLPAIAGADIVHVRFEPALEVPIDGIPLAFDLNQDGVDDIEFVNWYDPTGFSYDQSRVRGVNGTQVGWWWALAPREFALGELIGPDAEYSSESLMLDGAHGAKDYYDWNDFGGYLGLRIPVGDDFQYGWFNVGSMHFGPPNPITLTLYDFAYETTPNVSIRAGAIPAPGTLGALALGALSLGRRSRR
ncbi:MAG: hypothetical protein KF866_02395 [Phycisphaeraceae bacterium]|nr:hypothetical protein [Phycisphaeraceae bacterium]